MTKTFGRKSETRLLNEKLDNELEYLPTNSPILLKAIDKRTMSGGFFSTYLCSEKDLSLLIMDKYHFGKVTKAKNADKIIWTKEKVSFFRTSEKAI